MISWIRPSSTHFDHAVRAYSTELFRYASWLCKDRHRAEDILQEAFSRAWAAWNSLDDESARRSWLYTIVRNEYLRDSGRLAVRAEDQEDENTPDIPEDVDFTLGIEVRDLLGKLPNKFLEPLLLQCLMGMSCEEIATVMNLSVSAAMTRLTRARMALRELVGTDDRRAIVNSHLRVVQL